jgi:hypothetical protein
MERRENAIDLTNNRAQWLSLAEALHHFATYEGSTQSQLHIKPLHWYVACRLVIEGGFRPEDITPRPPLEVQTRGGKHVLVFNPSVATGGERTILGGLKTKNVDVVVTKDGIGPVLAVSCKGMQKAFRNLTNRMEETIGECTNLHITYPALVFGYMFVIRANRYVTRLASELPTEDAPPSRQLAENDIAIRDGGQPVESIMRFHTALSQMTGRHGIREDISRYEAVSLALVSPHAEDEGEVVETFPPEGSALRLDQFFSTLYLRYEERFVLGAPDLKATTQRLYWQENSAALCCETSSGTIELDYEPRVLAVDDAESTVSGIVATTNRRHR